MKNQKISTTSFKNEKIAKANTAKKFTHKLTVHVFEEDGVVNDVKISFLGDAKIFTRGMVAPMGERKAYDEFLELLCVEILRGGVRVSNQKIAKKKAAALKKKAVAKKSITPKKKKK